MVAIPPRRALYQESPPFEHYRLDAAEILRARGVSPTMPSVARSPRADASRAASRGGVQLWQVVSKVRLRLRFVLYAYSANLAA